MRVLGPIIMLVVYLVLQAAVAGRISIGAVGPDFVVVCVVLFGLERGTIPGSLFGFLVGLVVDLGNPGQLGLNALVDSVVGFAAGKLGSAASSGVLMLAIAFFVAALVHDVIYYFFYLWPSIGSAFVAIFTHALPSAVYTAVAGVAVERILALLGARVETTFGKARR